VPVLPGAEPFSADGGDVGVLLCHGFTGCPQSLRPWAEALARAGYTVRLPLLPGHGTTWQDMNRTSWQHWYDEVDRAFTELRSECRTVFVAGLSMGGALALRLAEQHGPDVAGIMLVNPAVHIRDRRLLALPVLRRVAPSFPPIGNDIKKPGATEVAYDRLPLHALASSLALYADVTAHLNRVDQPLLLLHSAVDHVVAPSNSAAILAGVSCADVTEIVLEDSYHVATLDNDAERIEKESIAFVARLSGTAEPSATDGPTDAVKGSAGDAT
jgi:carboxylesterase